MTCHMDVKVGVVISFLSLKEIIKRCDHWERKKENCDKFAYDNQMWGSKWIENAFGIALDSFLIC